MKRRFGGFLSVLVVLGGLHVGCKEGSDGSSDPKGPLEPLSENTKQVYVVGYTAGGEESYEGKIVGEVDVNGTTYKRYSFKPTQDPEGKSTEIFVSDYPPAADGTLKVGGVDEKDSLKIETDAPIEIDMTPPLGEPQEYEVDLTAKLRGFNISAPAHAVASYTLVEEGVSVETKVGMVHDCRHFTGTVRVEHEQLPENLNGVQVDGEAWVHDVMGIVAVDVPALGVRVTSGGLEDLGDPTGEKGSIRKMAVLDSSSPTYSLNTYDVNQKLDADKNKHAKMLLELRWADEDKARTDTEPGYPQVDIEFGTTMGIYPFQLTSSPVSLFHPEENGQGYTFWYAFVDQADKYQPENGISYHIDVSVDPDITPPLRVTGRIYYSRVLE